MILYEDFLISFFHKNKMYNITIKEEFIYDGASIPEFAWSLIGSPFTGEYRIPALVHDAFYKCADRGIFGREDVDCIFETLMSQFGEDTTTNFIIYQAVDKFGGSSWDDGSKTRANKAEFLNIEVNDV
tara:strand:- start:1588 stop:1971 length:384 start_codon:yes stop_codon:yes gene_type:complete